MGVLSIFAVVVLFIMALVSICLDDWTGVCIFVAAEFIVMGLSENFISKS